ncbi:chemotaxis protein [Helicobacter sp. MIT 14-3879]|uniref:chemotaxis protein n=1 Tax=Helicobacter sp. MIT 14-3879 TaxID=2040649 RepID=UPI000E1F081B|nr:chemotaxis protein [Helicobacter sp. MIT 14-3879]RDU64183.1 chemotaxis protein [Helicobacter sp. MIT 14-3879]
MTQEELNELILGNFNNEETKKEPQSNEENPLIETKTIKINDKNLDINHYRVSADEEWPPPPPTGDHKVVNQLDDVTKGLEVKATQVFDQLETISSNADLISKEIKKIKSYLESQKELFEKLSSQFPNIITFKESLKSSNEMIKQVNIIIEKSNENSDCILQAMDIMQYQDIHRQKIERVVNIMRTLAKYLNSMLDTDIDDEKRVSSATYIEGDKKSDVVDSDEIEALIASLGKK